MRNPFSIRSSRVSTDGEAPSDEFGVEVAKIARGVHALRSGTSALEIAHHHEQRVALAHAGEQVLPCPAAVPGRARVHELDCVSVVSLGTNIAVRRSMRASGTFTMPTRSLAARPRVRRHCAPACGSLEHGGLADWW